MHAWAASYQLFNSYDLNAPIVSLTLALHIVKLNGKIHADNLNSKFFFIYEQHWKAKKKKKISWTRVEERKKLFYELWLLDVFFPCFLNKKAHNFILLWAHKLCSWCRRKNIVSWNPSEESAYRREEPVNYVKCCWELNKVRTENRSLLSSRRLSN